VTTDLAIYFFFVMPLVVLAIGAGAAWLHHRSLQRRRHPPAE
jgi:hypothetical protein